VSIALAQALLALGHVESEMETARMTMSIQWKEVREAIGQVQDALDRLDPSGSCWDSV
jgi:hypothetical protein